MVIIYSLCVSNEDSYEFFVLKYEEVADKDDLMGLEDSSKRGDLVFLLGILLMMIASCNIFTNLGYQQFYNILYIMQVCFR